MAKRVFFVLLALAIVAILAVIVYNFVSERTERERFSAARTTVNNIANYLSQISHDGPVENNRCYLAEHGPYDNGRLWCEVSSAIYVSDRLNSADSMDKLSNFLNIRGLIVHDRSSNSLSFDAADRNKLDCRVNFYSDYSASHPSYGFLARDNAQSLFIIVCNGRSSAKIFPFKG